MRNKIAIALQWLVNKLTNKKDPVKYNDVQKLKEMGCAESGHLWTKFKNNDKLSKPIKERMYCRRCGQLYHEHVYIDTVVNN